MREPTEVTRAKNRERMQRLRDRDPEAASAKRRAWKEANPHRDAENRRMWNEAHPDYYRQHHRDNADRLNALSAAWRAANVETFRARQKAYRDSIPREQKLAYQRAWVAANREKHNEYAARRRARLRGAPVVEVIDRPAIIARDRSVCHLCRKRVAKRDLVLDHIVPLAIGGEHTHANLAVAHRSCNAAKRDRAANDQLRLVG